MSSRLIIPENSYLVRSRQHRPPLSVGVSFLKCLVHHITTKITFFFFEQHSSIFIVVAVTVWAMGTQQGVDADGVLETTPRADSTSTAAGKLSLSARLTSSTGDLSGLLRLLTTSFDCKIIISPTISSIRLQFVKKKRNECQLELKRINETYHDKVSINLWSDVLVSFNGSVTML